jgi:PKHD-type hydroxylase
MKGEWCYYKEYFTPEVCSHILDLGLKLPSKQATMGVDGSVSMSEYRRSKIRFIQQSDTNFTFLFDAMWKMAIQANDEWFKFNISRISYIQLAEYDASYQGEYKKHHDVFWMNGDPDYHRKITAIVQLTDPSTYVGGNLELFGLTEYPNSEEVRKQGTAFFFPSFLEHQATMVTKGTRYSLACWFDGPKWQ